MKNSFPPSLIFSRSKLRIAVTLSQGNISNARKSSSVFNVAPSIRNLRRKSQSKAFLCHAGFPPAMRMTSTF